MIKPVIKGNSIAIPSDQEFLPDVDIFIEGILRGFGADESIVADIAISVSELVNNAILHGNKSISDKAVTVTISKGNGEVAISVADQGGGFDPSGVENPIDDANLLKEVGRGIFIVKSLMDKVDIDASDIGTTIRITKEI
ncbi:MAG: ATP-binding protein [candidate division Zixibacteria bacterium]|nr:ATP-binding protein [candidate division Zixibacteria bacterium]MDH3938273.1 ATP-binding protein [candidate division Zixibacteria bacterium]MDH4032730.1 ATP-binding protein [candidate division Zixibacteria bacterium]